MCRQPVAPGLQVMQFVENHPADHHREHGNQDQRIDNRWIAHLEFVQPKPGLEGPERPLDIPASTVRQTDLAGLELIDGDVSGIEVIPLFGLVPEADDAECRRGSAARATGGLTAHRYLTHDVDDVVMVVIQDGLEVLTLEGDRVSPPGAELLSYHRVYIDFEPADESIAIGVDPITQYEFGLPEIE